MLEQVENKIKELEDQQREEYKKKKALDLSEWGFEKGKKGAKKLIVTDEEYIALLDAVNGTSQAGANKTARLMNFCSGFIIALGIVAAVIVAVLADSLGFVYFSAILFASVLGSALFRGIGEAIRLLQRLIDMKSVEKAGKAAQKVSSGPSFPESQPSSQRQFANAPPVYQSFTTAPLDENMF